MPDAAPLTVLIVDDDADMRLYLCGCVRRFGRWPLQILEAADGMEALLLVRTMPVDLVISDVVMPRLDGAALCRMLKADVALAAVPFVLISGEATDVLPDAGADAFLTKPFNTEQMAAVLRPLLPALPTTPPMRLL